MKKENPEKLNGIIATKGLPCTWKTQIAERIGARASLPVLCINDFLDYQDGDEAEHHLQQAFSTLCRVAERHFAPLTRRQISSSVIIKSHLNTKFEVSKLIDLTHRLKLRNSSTNIPLLIIECRMRSDFQWNYYVDEYRMKKENSDVCRAIMSWNEMEKARDDYVAQSQDWDDHLRRKIESIKDPPSIRWLVVDPLADLNLSPKNMYHETDELDGAGFFDAIRYLLTAREKDLKHRNPYVVEYHELRGILYDKEISALSWTGRSKYLCKGDCLFRTYWGSSQDRPESCWVCDKPVWGPGYTCYYCILYMHKSCAERVDMKSPLFLLDSKYLKLSSSNELASESYFPHNHACRSCIERGKSYSKDCGSCDFQRHLKFCLAPTVINHKSHQHFLSIHFRKHTFVCKACWLAGEGYSYSCKRCGLHYHLNCACLMGEFKHEHGGHDHTLKLMYSRLGMEPEESYWCDICCRDMDSQEWFYCCKECPYYIVHPRCFGVYKKTLKDAISFINSGSVI